MLQYLLLSYLRVWRLLFRGTGSSKEYVGASLTISVICPIHTLPSILLFVNHFHRLLGGEWDRYPIDAATLLKPALARRQIQLIGTCTLAQYRQYIERDAAMQRRFQEILMPDALAGVPTTPFFLLPPRVYQDKVDHKDQPEHHTQYALTGGEKGHSG